MYKTLYFDFPGIEPRRAHRLVAATLMHYGFTCPGVSGNYVKQSRGVAHLKIVTGHCADDHEAAAQLALRTLPTGTRLGIDHRNPFH